MQYDLRLQAAFVFASRDGASSDLAAVRQPKCYRAGHLLPQVVCLRSRQCSAHPNSRYPPAGHSPGLAMTT